MAFKLPSIPGPSKSKKYISFDNSVNVIDWNELTLLKEIGRGQFGVVEKIKYKGQDLVAKTLLSQHNEDRKSFLKEVNIMSQLSHPNVMGVKGVCPDHCSIIMEYMAFDFSVFGSDECVCSLSDFLNYVDRKDVVDQFNFFPLIGLNVAQGLQYLHENGIAHRDLKPGNILVSNQHYSSSSQAEIAQQYQTKPIMVKLADFGESRSQIHHTKTYLLTRTKGFGRGTLPYMAPEVQSASDILPDGATLEDLCRADIWSLGMTLFAIANPSVKQPYEMNVNRAIEEAEKGGIKKTKADIMEECPKPDDKYLPRQSTCWLAVYSAFESCTARIPSRRSNIDEVVKQLEVSSDPLIVDKSSMTCSQESAIVRADACLAKEMQAGDKSVRDFVHPPNDGTNACAFLSLMICDHVLYKTKTVQQIAAESSKIVENGPLLFNKNRSKDTNYSVSEAKKILQNDVLHHEYDIRELVISDNGVFTSSGRNDLFQGISSLKHQSRSIYTCQPYVFSVCSFDDEYLLIDTHPITAEGNGIVVKCATPLDMCIYIWDRLYHSGVAGQEPQSLCVLEVVERSQSHQKMKKLKTNDEFNGTHGDDKHHHKDGATLGNGIQDKHCITASGCFQDIDDTTTDDNDDDDKNFDDGGGVQDLDKCIHKTTARNCTVVQGTVDNTINSSTNHSRTSHPSTNHSHTSHPSSNHSGTSHLSTNHSRTSHPSTNHSRTSHPSTNHSRTSHPSSNHSRTSHIYSANEDTDQHLVDNRCTSTADESKMTAEADDDEDSNSERVTYKSKSKEQEFLNGVPVFEKGRKSRYTRSEAIHMLLKEKTQCDTHPLKVRENASFLVNVANYDPWEDVKADMNGVYDSNIRCGTWTVEIEDECSSSVISRQPEKLRSQSEYHLVQHIKKNKNNPALVRCIYLLKNMNGEIVNNACLIQYYITSGEENVSLMVQQHGNSKKRKNPFYPSKKSTLNNMKDLVKKKGSGGVYKDLKDSGGGACAQSPSDIPRGRQQIYNMKNRITTEVDPVNDLLIYARDNKNKIVLNHCDYPADVWVFGTDVMCNDLCRFTTSELLHRPFSVDATFELGSFEVTAIAYQHLLLKSIRTNEHPTFLGPSMIHHQKNYATYTVLSSTVAAHNKGMCQTKGFVTDGEQALLCAFKDDFRGAIGLRCFRHFHSNCTRKLHDIGIQKSSQQAFFIEKTFGVKGKTRGILDAANKKELRQMMNDAKADIQKKEKELLGKSNCSDTQYQSKYMAFLETNFDMMKNSLIQKPRRKAGLPNDENGDPKRSYTNGSESVNSLMKKKKEIFQQENPGKVLSKVGFAKHVFEVIHEEQMNELGLALASISQDYVMSDIAKHLEVPTETWFEWSREERENYINQVNKLSIREVFQQKKIPHPSGQISVQTPEYKEPEICISSFLQDHFDYSPENAEIVDERVISLLNHPTAVQRKATLELHGKVVFLVACRNAKNGYVEVTLFKDHGICTCGRYKHDKICAHSIAVASTGNILKNHLEWILRKRGVKNKTALAQYGVNVAVAGKKGAQNKYRYKKQQGVSGNPDVEPNESKYQEIYHNDNNFFVQFLSKNALTCKSCAVDFNHRQRIIPYDLVLSHKERWFFPVKGNWANKQATSKEATRYYHPRSACLKKRFPYFNNQYIEITDDVRLQLKDSHKQLLSREFGLDF